jgi:hypothetical protein
VARSDLPPAVQSEFFDFHWSEKRLWAVVERLPIFRLPLSQLEWQLDLPIWPRFHGQQIFDLRPTDVLRFPDAFPLHFSRIVSAAVEWPLIQMQNSAGRWVLMDGYHRLAKCKLLGRALVDVKRLDRSVIPAIYAETWSPVD